MKKQIHQKYRHYREAFQVGFYLQALLLIASVAVASETQNRPAEFIVGKTIMHADPISFGAEFDQDKQVNNWTDNPGMEALSMRGYWEISGGGNDAKGNYAVCPTRYYDQYDSGFFDGAHYRLYREDLTAGKIIKLSEGTIPAGGFIAAGYMQAGSIKAYAPSTDVVDNHYIENGETWYYAVKARDINNNWSEFSAAVAGVVSQAGIANGARIKTPTISNPVVGKAYTEASPLVSLTALGGTLPLTWSHSSGALPSGMTLTSAGKITGTCSVANEATFTIRVTDSAGKTQDRPFAFFRSPTGDGALPSAPANVVVEANDGFVHIRWDAPLENDINYYQVYRSRQPESAHMERIYLGNSTMTPASNDLLFVEMESLNAPSKKTRSIRVIQYQGETGWRGIGAHVTQEFVSHPGTLPAQFSSEYPGEGCLKLSDSAAESFGICDYQMASTSNSWWRVGQFVPGETYRMECWVYGEGLSDASLRFVFPKYTDQTVTGIANGSWKKMSVDFTVSEWITDGGMGVYGPTFYFKGPGTVYLDNVQVYNVNDPQGPCHYSQNIFDLWSDYVGPTDLKNKGVMRVRYNTESFHAIMNPAVMSQREWNATQGASDTDPLHIHDMFLEAYATGISSETRSIPWIIASLEWSEEDFVNLVEYMAGPAGTPYGDLRIEQRGGITTPWTDEFRKIYVEMGNEPWNTGYFFGFRGGFSNQSGTTYGRWCNYIWDYVWANTVSMNDSIKPVLGTWNSKRGEVGFTANAIRECPRAQHASMTMYIGGWEAGQEGQIGGTTWSDDGLQQWPTFIDRSGGHIVKGSVALQQAMAEEGRPFDWLVYEGGPSYLMNGLNGVSLTTEEQAVTRKYGRTLAAGIGTLDYYMYGEYRGIKENAFFGFSSERGLWASHNYIQNGHLPHPSFLATTLYNRYVSPASMLSTTSLKLPTFDLEYEKDGTIEVTSDVGLASAYAFRDGDRYLVLFLNKKVDGVHNGYDFGDGSTPASIQLPFASPASITLHKISGDPRETNVDQENVQIVSVPVSPSTFSKNFVVNETTGGVANGLPVGGIYLYEFKGCVSDSSIANPKAFVNQSVGQMDPAVDLPIEFDVFFDQSVSGFDASDIIQSGVAHASSIIVEEVAGSLGTTYKVFCDQIFSAGDLTLRIPAGAVVSLENGKSNVASMSTDNQVSVSTVPLAEWGFDVTPMVSPKAAAFKTPSLLSAQLTVGAGLALSANQASALRVSAFQENATLSQAVNNNDYVALTLEPLPQNGIHLSEVYFNQWEVLVEPATSSLEIYGRASTDGFATYTELGSFDGTTGRWGIPADSFLPLDITSNVGETLELRFYLVGPSSSYATWGVGDTDTLDGRVDIRLSGAISGEVSAGSSDGKVTREYWTNLNGSTLTDLTSHATYPDSPTGGDELTNGLDVNDWASESTANWSNIYGQRIRGYIVPEESGEYTFWIAGDDHCQFSLSSDESATHLNRACWVDGYTSPYQYNKYPSTQKSSTPITLTAGRSYYFEILHKEGWGNDNLSVAWSTESSIPNDASHIVPASALSSVPAQSTPAPVADQKVKREYWINTGTQSTLASFQPYLSTAASGADYLLHGMEAVGWDDSSKTYDLAEQYGQRITGYIIPETSGDYTFWIASDDASQFSLSSDDSPDNLTRKCYTDIWVLQYAFTRYDTQDSDPVSLVKGQPYYFEILHKEGRVGDHLSMAWSLDSTLTPGKEDIIPARVLSSVPAGGTTPEPPVNIAPVAEAGPAQTVTEGQSVTLSGAIEFDSDGWIVSRVWTEGATTHSSSLNPTLNLSVGPHTLILTVTDDDAATDSDTVVITVLAAPNVAPTANAGNSITVTADSSGAAAVALDGSNSSDSDGWIASQVWKDNGVQISTSLTPTVSLSAGTHPLTLVVTDNDGAASASASVTITVQAEPSGGTLDQLVNRDYWLNFTSTSFADLTGTPDGSDWLGSGLEALGWVGSANEGGTQNFDEYYGERMFGYIIPEITGDYTFWIAGDNYSEFDLSTTDQPADLIPLCWIEGWTWPRTFTSVAVGASVSQQKSDPVHLIAGQDYYFELLHIEEDGGDHVSIAWSTNPNITPTEAHIVPSDVLSSVPVGSSGSGGPNLALGRPATQSSTPWGSMPASVCVDGVIESESISHTGNDMNAWWEVDLESVQSITKIQIFNRMGPYQSRLDHYYVLASADPFISHDLSTTLAQPGVWSELHTEKAEFPTEITLSMPARYIRIQLNEQDYLHMTEVQVLGE